MSFTKVTATQTSKCICLEDTPEGSEVYVHENGGELHPFHTGCIDIIVDFKKGENITCPVCNMTISKVNGVFLIVAGMTEMDAIDHAAKTNNLSLARYLIQVSQNPDHLRGVGVGRGINYNKPIFFQTLLLDGPILEQERGDAVFKASWGNVDTVRLLLQNGTINETHLASSINVAAGQGNTEILSTLLQGRTISIENRGKSLLSAVGSHQLGTAQILLDNGLISSGDSFHAIRHAVDAGDYTIAGAVMSAKISSLAQSTFGAQVGDNLAHAHND